MVQPLDTRRMPGRPLYAAPGPTNIPEQVQQAIGRATTDFMGAAFLPIYHACVEGLQRVLGTAAPVFFYAASGHGGWEATMVNLFSPDDTVLMLHTGVFSGFWTSICVALGLRVETLASDPRVGVDPQVLEATLAADRTHRIAAVCVVHNDTASGVRLPVEEIRAAMDAARHPALLVLDTISSAASLPLHMDDWRVDAAIGSCQKGLMLPPGLAFTAVGPLAMARHRTATLPRAYFDWTRMTTRSHAHSAGTMSAALFAGLHQSLAMIEAEGLPDVFARHARLAAAIRAAIAGWSSVPGGPELYCRVPARASAAVSALLLPPGVAATPIRRIALLRYNVTLGADLGMFEDRLFRIGHMGDLNETMVLGMVGAVELSLQGAHIPHGPGLAAALDALAGA